jgi:hypothetical protein
MVGHTQPKIIESFAALKRPLAKAAIWPVVSGGPSHRQSFSELFAWPDVSARLLTPSKLAAVAHAAIVPPSIGEGRLGRMRSLASAVSSPLDPSEATLSGWVEAIAEQIASTGRSSARRWRGFYMTWRRSTPPQTIGSPRSRERGSFPMLTARR